MQQNYIGLYYPYIHFRSESWLKLAVLYWDKMARIVPHEDAPHDSESVLKLKYELDFIEEHVPCIEVENLANSFLDLIQESESQLVERYRVGIQQVGLAEVYFGKMSGRLRIGLLNTGLAVKEEHQDEILKMHSMLASVYMTALAKEMGTRRQYYPVTDNAREHVAVAGHTAQQLAQVLLEDGSTGNHEQRLTEPDLEQQIANIAIESVLPENIAAVPIEKIIQVRKRHRDEIRRFQMHFHSVVTDAEWLKDVTDAKALHSHLERLYEENLKRELNDLKANLRRWGIDTVQSSLNVQTTVPPLAAGGVIGGLAQDPIIGAAGSIAFAAFSVLLDTKKKRREILRSSPAAYLLHMEENLTPSTLLSRVSQRARSFTFGA